MGGRSGDAATRSFADLLDIDMPDLPEEAGTTRLAAGGLVFVAAASFSEASAEVSALWRSRRQAHARPKHGTRLNGSVPRQASSRARTGSASV